MGSRSITRLSGGLRVALVLVATTFLGTAVRSVEAQCDPVETFKLLADDGAEGDRFGISVAISGTTAIIGAEGINDMPGSAFIFDTTTGQQLFKILASDGAAGDHFGCSVAISGITAIVGAYGDDDNGDYSGSAYIFDTTTGQELFKLLPSDGTEQNRFSISVAVSGATAIVGANGDDDNGNYSGSAYIFDTTTGQQLFKILPSDGAASDYFGSAVGLSGTTAIVGAPLDDDNGDYSGSAYIFDTTTGQQLFKLLPSDGAAEDYFGSAVAISGTTAVVGAYWDDDNGTNSGSAYLFDTTTGQQLFKILPSDGAANDAFGYPVATSGTAAIVGASEDGDNGNGSGSAYLFDTTTGQQLFKILASDGAAYDYFGWSVGIGGATAIVGAPLDDDNGASSGSAYFFDFGLPTLSASATCPSGGSITVDWSCATPDGQIALIFAANTGGFIVPGGYPCAGTQLGLGTSAIQIAYTGVSDATGSGVLNASAPSAACGGYLQLIDLDMCAVSNVVMIE